MATKGFTKIDNCILLDEELSLEAKGLYAILKHLSGIPNFSIRRDYIKSVSGYGETAFRRVWKELKDKGLLLETKLREKGKYIYKYILKTNEDKTIRKAPRKESKPKHIDSDGNVPIDGQVNIDDVLGADSEENKTNGNIEEIVKSTGFDNSQAKEILQIANNDVKKVINGHRYAMSQKEVKNIFAYTKWSIRNNKTIFESAKRNESSVKSTFNHFPQRKYDFKKLERALLYGEPYELPA